MRKTEELRGMKIEYFMPRKMSNENEMETYKSDSSNFHGCRRTYMDGCVTLTANNEGNFFLVCLPATNTFATLTRAFVYFMILTYLHLYKSQARNYEKKTPILAFYILMVPSFFLSPTTIVLTFHSFIHSTAFELTYFIILVDLLR